MMFECNDDFDAQGMTGTWPVKSIAKIQAFLEVMLVLKIENCLEEIRSTDKMSNNDCSANPRSQIAHNQCHSYPVAPNKFLRGRIRS